MAQKVADVTWEIVARACVKRCYGFVGDALDPVIDALRRNGEIEFLHARHKEFGVFCQGRNDRREEHPNRGTWRSERKRSLVHSRIKGGPVVVDSVVDPHAHRCHRMFRSMWLRTSPKPCRQALTGEMDSVQDDRKRRAVDLISSKIYERHDKIE